MIILYVHTMAQTKFKFIIVLHADKVKDFTDLLDSHCKQECGSWFWDVVRDEPERPRVQGKLTFEKNRTLCDVKRWFVSIFGNTLCEHLSVEMVDGRDDGMYGLLHKPPPDFLKSKLYKKYGWKI